MPMLLKIALGVTIAGFVVGAAVLIDTVIVRAISQVMDVLAP